MHPREHELNPDAADADARIARALQRLPDPEPPRDGWDQLQRRLGQPEPWRGWVPTAAVAASALVLALGLLLRSATTVQLPAPGDDTVGVVVSTPLDVDDGGPRSLAEWRTRSAELERVLAALPEPRVTRASTGATTALLEDRIATIDDQLSDVLGDGRAGQDPSAEAGVLLRQRALLLDSLVRVRYAAAVDPGT
jgi:hypothetical protein